jgi:hypothetical protein
MVKAVFLVMFYILIGLSMGFVNTVFTTTDSLGNTHAFFDGVFSIGANNMGDQTDINGSVTTLQELVQPSNTLENKGNLFYRIFDMLNLGFLSKLQDFIKGALGGIPQMFVSIFQTQMCDGAVSCPTSTWAYWILVTLNSLIYALGFLLLFTGRDVTEG